MNTCDMGNLNFAPAQGGGGEPVPEVSAQEVRGLPGDWPDISSAGPDEIKMLVADIDLIGFYFDGLIDVDWGDGNVVENATTGYLSHTHPKGLGMPCSEGYTTFVVTIKVKSEQLTLFRVDNPDEDYKHINPLLWIMVGFANIVEFRLTGYTGRPLYRAIELPEVMPVLTTLNSCASNSVLSFLKLPKYAPSLQDCASAFSYAVGLIYKFPSCAGNTGSGMNLTIPNFIEVDFSGVENGGIATVGDSLITRKLVYMQNLSTYSIMIGGTYWRNLQEIVLPVTAPNITMCTVQYTNLMGLFILKRYHETPIAVTYNYNVISDGLVVEHPVSKLTATGNTLLKVIRLNAPGSTYSGSSPQVDVRNNNLDEAAINQLFTDIVASGDFTGKTVRVTGNPGAATCDTSIITNAGGTVTTT